MEAVIGFDVGATVTDLSVAGARIVGPTTRGGATRPTLGHPDVTAGYLDEAAGGDRPRPPMEEQAT
jgi:hypothetical protein